MTEMKEEALLEPNKVYSELKDVVHQNAVQYFDDLVKNSNTDEEANTKLCASYYAKLSELEEAKKKASSSRSLTIFLIVVSVLSLVISLLLFFSSVQSGDFRVVPFLFALFLLALGIVCIVLINTKVKHAQQAHDARAAELDTEAKKIRAEIDPMVASLMSSFTWGMPQSVIRMSAPLIQLDSYLDVKKYDYMVQKYGLQNNGDPHSSIFTLLSGSIQGNPFFLERRFNQTDGMKTYSNSITIHWTTWRQDSKGHSYPVSHSETLTASVTRPCPYYGFDTYLVYCNDAAPNLCFSRQPTVDKNANEKQIAKQVRRDDKRMDKLAEQDMNDDDPNTNFTEMSNTEFESLFHAWDRNDEVEFRLLFTPLAQNNMTSLLKRKEPYGDDFSFTKTHRINVIRSEHAQHLDFEADPARFYGFDIKAMRETFCEYTDTLFRSLFFDIAPLISIPLYQQMKPIEYIYKDIYPSNVSFYEHEVAANGFRQEAFKPANAVTPCILKASFDNKQGEFDDVSVRAYAFRTVSHTEIFTKMGGDGSLHNIPVTWLEYIPVSKVTKMQVRHLPLSLPEYRKQNGNPDFTRNFRNEIEALLR